MKSSTRLNHSSSKNNIQNNNLSLSKNPFFLNGKNKFDYNQNINVQWSKHFESIKTKLKHKPEDQLKKNEVKSEKKVDQPKINIDNINDNEYFIQTRILIEPISTKNIRSKINEIKNDIGNSDIGNFPNFETLINFRSTRNFNSKNINAIKNGINIE